MASCSAPSPPSCGSSTRPSSSSATTTPPTRPRAASRSCGRPTVLTDRDAVLDEIRDSQRFVLCTHEHPDGDALGSLAGMQQALTALGKEGGSFMAAEEFPLPYEYRFLKFERLVTTVPEDFEDRTIIFLDCGNIDRNPADAFK